MNKNIEDTINFKNVDKLIIKNKELNRLLQFRLNKTYFEAEDLQDIKDIIIDGKTISGDINIVDFNDLDFFKNLKKVDLKNIEISKEYMNKFADIEEISFLNCEIESIEEIKKIKKISINNSTFDNFNEITNLKNIEELEIINTEIRDYDFLKMFENLKVLKIKNVKNFTLNRINFFLPIIYFSIRGVNDLDVDFLKKNYPNLKTFSIDIEKKAEWLEKINELKTMGISVLLNDIYKY